MKVEVTVNGEWVRIWNNVIVTYLKEQSRHSAAETEDMLHRLNSEKLILLLNLEASAYPIPVVLH
jgi:hypothetical protein